jgi:hypothetical protein
MLMKYQSQSRTGEGTKPSGILHWSSFPMVGNSCPHLQTWNTTTLYFVERFGGKKLSAQVNIPTFKPGFDPVAHIHQCENEWRRVGYRDERVWPHMFPNTLDDIPHKWYKIEEACGHTFNWNEIKENFIRDFEFIPEEAHLREATQEIKNFLEKPNP